MNRDCVAAPGSRVVYNSIADSNKGKTKETEVDTGDEKKKIMKKKKKKKKKKKVMMMMMMKANTNKRKCNRDINN